MAEELIKPDAHGALLNPNQYVIVDYNFQIVD